MEPPETQGWLPGQHTTPRAVASRLPGRAVDRSIADSSLCSRTLFGPTDTSPLSRPRPLNTPSDVGWKGAKIVCDQLVSDQPTASMTSLRINCVHATAVQNPLRFRAYAHRPTQVLRVDHQEE